MAAKVIHFKKNGSSAPQKFVADDGGNNISAFLSSPRGAETIFLPFYRRRAARKRYFCRFIVAVQRGNDIFAVLSSPCGAETILLPFYRHRAARKRYFCPFIVTVRRGNDIFALLSSPCGAGTIFLHFSACCAPANTFPNGFGVCSPTSSIQKCGENRAGMVAVYLQK